MNSTPPAPFCKQDFRQHYFYGDHLRPPAPHWVLSFGPGRDLLKAVLRRLNPSIKVPFFGKDAHMNPRLEGVVDLLGLRAIPKPQSNVEWCYASFQFVRGIALVQFGRTRRHMSG